MKKIIEKMIEDDDVRFIFGIVIGVVVIAIVCGIVFGIPTVLVE